MTSSADFLGVAHAIGGRLCRDAYLGPEGCVWLDTAPEMRGAHWRAVSRSCGPDLYGGTAGIGLFLAHLFDATGDSVIRHHAEAAARYALSHASTLPPPRQRGFYTGLLGIAFAVSEIGRLSGSETLCFGADAVLQKVLDAPAEGSLVDVLAGDSGSIPILLGMASRSPRSTELIDCARGFGRRLLTLADRSEAGWSWDTTPASEPRPKANLTGFSHGAGGIGWSLLELFAVTGEDCFREAATEAFAYERHLFSKQHGNWPDLRDMSVLGVKDSPDPSFMAAWCHGAPGIGLSRLRAAEILGDDELRREAEVGLATTTAYFQNLDQQRATGFSLCHGDAGNADILLAASRMGGTPEMRETAERVGRYGKARFHDTRRGWPCGSRDGSESPGLLLGLAGIGFFFLRLRDPESVPSLMLVTPASLAGTLTSRKAVA